MQGIINGFANPEFSGFVPNDTDMVEDVGDDDGYWQDDDDGFDAFSILRA